MRFAYTFVAAKSDLCYGTTRWGRSETIKDISQWFNSQHQGTCRESKLTPSPVVQRVKRLQTNGYIKKYIALLNPEKFNQGFIVFCNITLKQHDRQMGHSFAQDILQIDEVVECYNISGDYDFFLKVFARDMKHYQDFVFNKLGSVKSIGSAHSTFVMAEIKNTHNIWF